MVQDLVRIEASARSVGFDPPITVQGSSFRVRLVNQAAGRRQDTNRFQKRILGHELSERKELRDPTGTRHARNVGVREQGLDLGGEYKPPRELDIVEWFHAEPIPQQDQSTFAKAIDRRRERSMKLVEKGLPPTLVTVQQKFRVTLTTESVTEGDQISALLVIVMNLSFHHRQEGTILVVSGLF